MTPLRQSGARHPGLLPLYLLPALCLMWMAGLLIGRASSALWPCLAAAALAGIAACLWRGNRRAVLCVFTLCAGAAAGYLAWHPALPAEGTHEVSGYVAEEVHVSEDGHIRTALRGVTVDGAPMRGGLYWTMYASDADEAQSLAAALTPGQGVRVIARVYHPSGAVNPGGFDFREYLLQQGIRAGLYGGQDTLAAADAGFSPFALAARLRHVLTLRLQALLGEEAGSYAATVLIGARHLVPEEDRAAFSRLGISHILSVSGFHVGVLAAAAAALLRRLEASRRQRLAVLAAALTAYAWLTGLRAPVLRAVILSLTWQYGRVRNRRGHSLHLLSFAALVTLAAFPTQLTAAGFHMSYGALLGLIIVCPPLRERFAWRRNRFSRVKEALIASAAAQAGLALPMLYWYQEIPLWGLVINPLLLAVTPALMAAESAALILGRIPLAGPLIAHGAAALTRLFLRGIRLLGALPGGMLWTAQANLLTALGGCLALAGCAAFLRLTRRSRIALAALGCALAVFSVIPPPHTGVDYIQLAVGSADAAVLHDGGHVAVIDTGEDGFALSQYLKQRRMSVDTLILTHLHRDHAGGVQALLDERIPVRKCYLPEGALEADVQSGMAELLDSLRRTGTEIAFLAKGDTLSLPHGRMTAVWPERGRVRPGRDANESCLVLLADIRGTSLLLTGDLDGRYESYAAPQADILKVAHHGSASSTSADYLGRVAPQTLILSCGDDQRPEALAARAAGRLIFSTRALGAVTVTFTDGGYTVEGFLEPEQSE